MFYGLNEKGERIYIKDSIKGKKYYCPCCNGELRRKLGSINAHHFAHVSAVCDSWYSENKGPWHIMLQDCFPRDNQEVFIRNEDKVHIADVYLEGNYQDTVIEFQHSPMSKDEFIERTSFYTYNGGKDKYRGGHWGYGFIENRVVWVFDFRGKKIDLLLNNRNYDLNKTSYYYGFYDKLYYDMECSVLWNRTPMVFLSRNILTGIKPKIFLCVDEEQFNLYGKKKEGKDSLYFLEVNEYKIDKKYVKCHVLNFDSFIEYIKNIDEIEVKKCGLLGYYPYDELLIDKHAEDFIRSELLIDEIEKEETLINKMSSNGMLYYG